jgi:hypothetical protein
MRERSRSRRRGRRSRRRRSRRGRRPPPALNVPREEAAVELRAAPAAGRQDARQPP